MNDEHRKIIIKRIYSDNQQGQGENAQYRAPFTPMNRWVALLVMIPVLALLAVLGVFFFTIFVALFSVLAAIFGVRLWWFRKKYRDAMQQKQTAHSEHATNHSATSESIYAEDAEIIEETTVTKEATAANNNNDKRKTKI